jgi:hypothetical protein
VIGPFPFRLTLLATLVACGGAEAEPVGSGGGQGGLGQGGLGQGGIAASALPYEPCPYEARVGQFTIELTPEYTSVDGKVSDGPLPTQVPDELARAGDCRLLKARVGACASACPAATQVCSNDGRCMPRPLAHDLGAVTVQGLVIPMVMTSNAVTHGYSNPAQPMLPNPGFLPGADLRVTTGGGDYAPFELRGWGVSLLELASVPAAHVSAGVATQVSWRASSSAGPARLQAKLQVNHHGSSSAWLECDFPDTGAAEIPAELIDALLAEGLSGDPTLTATRRSATSVEIEPGCVELLVASKIEASIEVEGLTTCDDSSMCPSGQSCLPVERFCQ